MPETYLELPRFDVAKLRRALLVRGLSARRAAREARVDPETMSRALRGDGLSASTFAAIAGMLERVPPQMAGDPGDLLAEDRGS